MLSASSAFAKPASVFMLQFGSFESRGEADTRLNELKTKHSGIVGSLPTRVLEVNLPDNLTVYRTQAGPVPSRADAQTLCGQLASNGDECYVVETAMNTAPTLQTAAAAPAPAAAPVVQMPEIQKVPAETSTEMPTVRALTSAPSVTARTASAAPAAALAAKPAVEAEERPGFWSRLNPFSESEPEAPAPKAVVEAPKAAPVAAVAEARPVVSLPSVPVAAPSASPSSLAMQLPPPPPLTGRAQSIYAQNTQASATVPAPLPVASAPVATAGTPFANASAETMAKAGVPAGVAVTNAPGAVTVGEAQRVPLSQQAQPLFVPADSSTMIPQPGMMQPAQQYASPEAALPPSQPMGKTHWAEIGRFSSAPDALAYWDQYRNANPDFPVVRVRVTQAYTDRLRGSEAVSLRVGPFAKPQALDYLCRTVNEAEKGPKLDCKRITDLGISTGPSLPRQRVLMGEAFARRAMMQSPAQGDQFWLQLGSYPTMMQAQNAWDDLKAKHGNALPGAAPNISVPAMGSSAPSYRLRSGPFVRQTDAQAACLLVKNSGGNCIVSAN